MDAQGRGRADDIDPADQWVFNPDTGNYELRLDPAADSASLPSGRSAAVPRPSGRAPGQRRFDTRELPTQRDRRATGRPATASGPVNRRKPKPKKSGKKKVWYWTAGSVGLVLVASCSFGYYWYERLDGNITKVDVGMDNAAITDGPVNILIIGTDAREGKGNEGYGDAGSVGHADTTILMHVSKDRSNATAMSIPRDMITDIPDCPTKQKDGSTKTVPGQRNVRFNTSLGQNDRDPGCTWRTVEKMTGLRINHFMMADFNAVKELSTAVGGVEVCAAKPIDDPKSHLKLAAGKHMVAGEQALAFVRTRHSVGFGSDLSRIELQQQFLGSLMRKMKSGDTLTNPSKLLDLSEVATKALTVDTGIGSAKKLMDLAQDLSRIDIKNVTFATVPVLDNPRDKATVVLDKAKAEPLFKMVRADNSLTKTDQGKSKGDGKDGDKGGEKADGGKKDKSVPKAPAEEVRVDITNGGGPSGAAQETVDWMRNSKNAALSTNSGNAPVTLDTTRLEYAPNQAAQAATLAEWLGLPDSALKKTSSDAGPRVPMKLILGKDFKAPGEPVSAPTKTPEGVQNVNADDKNVCAK